MALVTWVGRVTQPAIRATEDAALARIHFLVVDHLTGIGLLVAGWIADPLSMMAAILIETGNNQTLDLLANAMLVTNRRYLTGFQVPDGVAVGIGFVLLVPERSNETADRLQLRLRMASGEVCDRVVPEVGDLLDLTDVLAAAPVDIALRTTERLIKTWHSTVGHAQRPPARIEAVAREIHQRIDPLFDYGAYPGQTRTTGHVDVAIRVGSAGILFAGWMLPDHTDRTTEIALVSLFGQRVALGLPLPVKSRPDVQASEGGTLATADCGFAAFAAIDGLNPRDAHWFLEVLTESGSIRRIPFVCPPTPLPLDGVAAAVMLAEERDPNLRDLFQRALFPAVEWFWATNRCPELTSTEMVFGCPPSEPTVSVIVPVYGRLDFVRHQIAGFSNDLEFRAGNGTIELIYVLDDPKEAVAFIRSCQFLYDVYAVPFRIVIQGKNRGYSAATNAGAAVARGRLLLLLNSDVFPTRPRWVGQLVTTYETLDSCGILGCRLLFEDGSIQHAGMSFRTSRMLSGCWENDHPGRGLSVALDPHAGVQQVPAVTGACLMIERTLFNRLGGLSEDYVIGDFEDSDLCLRAQENGFKVYYTPAVELYHLERQSMRLVAQGNVSWRQSLTLYNMWKHTLRWGEFIPKVLERIEGLRDLDNLVVPAGSGRDTAIGDELSAAQATADQTEQQGVLVRTAKRPARKGGRGKA